MNRGGVPRKFESNIVDYYILRKLKNGLPQRAARSPDEYKEDLQKVREFLMNPHINPMHKREILSEFDTNPIFASNFEDEKCMDEIELICRYAAENEYQIRKCQEYNRKKASQIANIFDEFGGNGKKNNKRRRQKYSLRHLRLRSSKRRSGILRRLHKSKTHKSKTHKSKTNKSKTNKIK